MGQTATIQQAPQLRVVPRVPSRPANPCLEPGDLIKQYQRLVAKVKREVNDYVRESVWLDDSTGRACLLAPTEISARVASVYEWTVGAVHHGLHATLEDAEGIAHNMIRQSLLRQLTVMSSEKRLDPADKEDMVPWERLAKQYGIERTELYWPVTAAQNLDFP